MATTFEELIGRVSVQGAEKSKRDVDSVRSSFRSLGETIENIGTLGGITYLFSQIGEVMRALGNFSGASSAANIISISNAIRALTGDSTKAATAMRDIQALAARSPFDVQNVAAFAQQMLGAGVATDKLSGELSKLIDATSFAGVGNSDISSVLFNLLQIRSMDSAKADFADVREMLSRAPGMGRVLSKGLGIPQSELMGKLRGGSMTGGEIYQAVLKGAGSPGIAGAGQRATEQNPIVGLQKLFATLNEVMIPTGKILVGIFQMVRPMLQGVANSLKAINQMSGGIAGLLTIVGGGLFIATRALTLQMGKLALSMMAAAGAASTATAVNAGAAAAGGGAWVTGAGAAVLALWTAASSLARIIPVIAIAIGAANAINHITNPEKKRGFYGTLEDRARAGIDKATGKPGASAPVTPAQVEEQKKTNKLLEEIKTQLYGGGARSASAMSDYIAEYQIAKALAL